MSKADTSLPDTCRLSRLLPHSFYSLLLNPALHTKVGKKPHTHTKTPIFLSI